jgi:phosphoenolpyruvate synthase/pyruvate phosphate dikinase
MVYKKNKIFTDEKFLDNLIKSIAQLGISVEDLYEKQPQDIEGVLYNDEFYIVQTRPQV